MKNKKLLGIIIFIVLIVIIIGIKFFQQKEQEGEYTGPLKTVYIATGGGKEDFIADEEVVGIMKKQYGLDITYDSWSNGRLIIDPLKREDGSDYDAMFCSDQRFYDYYKLSPDKTAGEAERYRVLNGGLTLNTPIVIYSWAEVTDALIKENIVTLTDDIYYITDMNKLFQYILEGRKWSDIGLDMLYGSVNIASTDPVTSSPGATYYGLLLSVMCEGNVTDENMLENLPKLKEFYIKSGYMNNTPADLFERYLKTGMGGEPMIVDYEKSIVDFANSNSDGFAQVKDDIRILYPKPTIWNSHCIATFSEGGNEFYAAFENDRIQQIAWEKYGFRTGITGGNYDVSKLGIKGMPKTITSTVTSLKMSIYNSLIDHLK